MTSNETPASNITPQQMRLTIGCLGLAIIAGAALTIFGVLFLIEGNASRSWPTVEGDVRGIFVRSHTSDSGSRSYTYEVTYDYVVNDQRYNSDRYSLGEGSTASNRYNNEADARADGRAQYPASSAITVYYDPEDPASAVLRPGANWGTYMPLLMGLLFIISGVAFIILIVRNNRRRNT